jgi:hypothetical protein
MAKPDNSPHKAAPTFNSGRWAISTMKGDQRAKREALLECGDEGCLQHAQNREPRERHYPLPTARMIAIGAPTAKQPADEAVRQISANQNRKRMFRRPGCRSVGRSKAVNTKKRVVGLGP